MTLNNDQFEQLSLFDKDDYNSPPPDLGELSMDDWMDKTNPVYHGSMRSDWTKAPVHHFGTKDQALVRIEDMSSNIAHNASDNNRYYGVKSDDPMTPVKTEHEGRMYARRLIDQTPREDPSMGIAKNLPMSDQQANAAEVGFRWEEGANIPTSTEGSAGMLRPDYGVHGDGGNEALFDKNEPGASTARRGMKDMQQGHSISYKNEYEDGGSSMPSYVAPPEATTSWERDVLKAPRAAEGAKRYAQQRIDSGKEGSVPFREPHTRAFKDLAPNISSYQFSSAMSSPENQGAITQRIELPKE